MKKLFLLHLFFEFSFCVMHAGGELPSDNERSKIYEIVACAVQQKSSQVTQILSDAQETVTQKYQSISSSMQNSVETHRHIREKVDQIFELLTTSPDKVKDLLGTVSSNHESLLLIDGAFDDDNVYEELLRTHYMIAMPMPSGNNNSRGRDAKDQATNSNLGQAAVSGETSQSQSGTSDNNTKTTQRRMTFSGYVFDNKYRSSHEDNYEQLFHDKILRDKYVKDEKDRAEKIESGKSALVAYGYDFKKYEDLTEQLKDAQNKTKEIEKIVDALLVGGIPVVPLIVGSGLLGPIGGVAVGAIYLGVTTKGILEYRKNFAHEIEAHRELEDEQLKQIDTIERFEELMQGHIQEAAQRSALVEERFIKKEERNIKALDQLFTIDMQVKKAIEACEELKSQMLLAASFYDDSEKLIVEDFSIENFFEVPLDEQEFRKYPPRYKFVIISNTINCRDVVEKNKQDRFGQHMNFSLAVGLGGAVAISNIAYSVFIGSLGHFQETILHDKDFAARYPEIANALAGSFSGLDRMMNHTHIYNGPGVSANIKPFFEQLSGVSQRAVQLMSFSVKPYCDFIISKVSERMGGDKNFLDACGNPKYISILNSYADGILIQGFDGDSNIVKTIVVPKSDKIAPYEFSLDRDIQKKYEELEEFQNKVDNRIAQGVVMNKSNQFAHELPYDFSPATNKKGELLRAEDGGQLSAQGESWKWSNKKQGWIVKSVDGKKRSVSKSTITTVAQMEKEKQARIDEQHKKAEELARVQQATQEQQKAAMAPAEKLPPSQGCGSMDIAQPVKDHQGCGGMDIEGNNSPTIRVTPILEQEKPEPGCGPPIDPVPTKTDTAHETSEDFTHQYFESQKDDTQRKEGDLSNVDVRFREDNRTHIFDDRPGHLIDTPENRKRVVDLVKNPENFVTKDRHGKLWFGKILPNGTQLWAHVVKGVVTNCGLNQTPLESDPEYGYSNPNKPKQKQI